MHRQKGGKRLLGAGWIVGGSIRKACLCLLIMGSVDAHTFTRQPVYTLNTESVDQHFPKDDKLKLLLDPDNSIEMFWKVHKPAPDIAGLKSVLKDLLQLPGSLISNQDLMTCRKLATLIPALPKGESNGVEVLLPYTGAQTAKGRNLENPELFAIYHFRLFGIGMPDLAPPWKPS